MQHFVLTLDGTAQRLSSALATDDQINRRPFRLLLFSALGANGNPIFIGGPDTASATDYGIRINAPPANIPEAPVRWGPFESGPAKLEEIFVFGTDTEVLHIAAEEF